MRRREELRGLVEGAERRWKGVGGGEKRRELGGGDEKGKENPWARRRGSAGEGWQPEGWRPGDVDR